MTIDAAADSVLAAFTAWDGEFRAITRRAAARFATRDWRAGQRDAAERLALYRTWVERAVADTERALGARARDRDAWEAMRDAYAARVRDRGDCEIAETFFNSVTRRLFTTVGVDPRVEFVRPDVHDPDDREIADVTRPLPVDGGAVPLARAALGGALTRWADFERDVRHVAQAIERGVGAALGGAPDRAEMIDAVFYRNKGAYLVGRLRRGEVACPLVVALVHDAAGVAADAVLLSADEASIVFGFAWSYFHVETTRPRALVALLASILPLKRIDELYAAIGYHKHAKTELYRALLEHLADPAARFERAEGARGLVMEVFTLPSLNVVFKIIKDQFGAPKRTTRRDVMERYQFVFVRDRVGRLADAQEFEHLRFERRCFPEPLLAELLAAAPSIVHADATHVVITHLYTERRLAPLNLYVRDVSPEAAVAAIVDYGQAIRDLTAADIFTGDMLLKNFGVSRHGRVIFYDYDELATIGECNFRELPQSSRDDDEISAEPWFSVAEHDVFPEEFLRFLVPAGPLRDAFMAHHAELLDPRWWRDVQARIRAGELVDVYPYPAKRRLTR
jgi:isocitrate dehydrogenase kinase/phosphatase